jgi:hypothetical protein
MVQTDEINAAPDRQEFSQDATDTFAPGYNQPSAPSGGVVSAGSVAGAHAPAFNAQEKAIIAAWSATIQPHGLRAEISSDHTFLKEALHVTAGSAEQPRWVVHKTPAGAVAVRLWPGLADIVTTLPEALDIVADAEAKRRA